MNWEDEPFIKIYTRDTPEWCVRSWEARALLLFILRKVDRAGVLALGPSGMKALAALLRVPIQFVERAAPELLEDQSITIGDGVLVVPNFVEAQSARQSDRARARASRARARDAAKTVAVTKRDGSVTHAHDCAKTPEADSDATVNGETSDPCRDEPDGNTARLGVTNCDGAITPSDDSITIGHTASHGVTDRHSRREETRSDEKREPDRAQARTRARVQGQGPAPESGSLSVPLFEREKLEKRLEKLPRLATAVSAEQVLAVLAALAAGGGPPVSASLDVLGDVEAKLASRRGASVEQVLDLVRTFALAAARRASTAPARTKRRSFDDAADPPPAPRKPMTREEAERAPPGIREAALRLVERDALAGGTS